MLIYLITVAQGAGINTPGRQALRKWVLFGPAVAQGRLVEAVHLGVPARERPPHRAEHARDRLARRAGRALRRAPALSRDLHRLGSRRRCGRAGRQPDAITVGASGAVFGILGALLIIEYQQTGSITGQAFTLIVINLAFSFTVSGISVGGHIGGLIGGIALDARAVSLRPRHVAYGRPGLSASPRSSASASSASRSRTGGARVRVRRLAVVVLCALVFVSRSRRAAAIRRARRQPPFRVADRPAHPGRHLIVGWGQGATWGSRFARMFTTMGDVPMLGFGASMLGREAITPARSRPAKAMPT